MDMLEELDPAVELPAFTQEPEADFEAWTPEDFDHFTDLGLLRTVNVAG